MPAIRDERTFALGDTLRLLEWDPFRKEHTGRELLARVTHLTPGGEWGLPLDVCVMSLDEVHEPSTARCAICDELLTGAWFVTRGVPFCSIEHERVWLANRASPIRSNTSEGK